MKIRIEEDILSGTGAEIMDQLRARVFDPTEFPDTESYIWFLRNNVVRTTGLDFPLPEGKIAAAAVGLYPPGIPLLAPGERVTREIIRQLQEAGTRERFGVEGDDLRCANV